MPVLEVIQGDITKQSVDAIVNAANESLMGGGGVDGAIHRAAGPELLLECRVIGGCPTGEARLTKGYHLPSRFVIHTVGPVWKGGGHREDELLMNCYQNSIELAAKNRLKTIAFPSISTGAYRFPIERACRIAVETVSGFFGMSSPKSLIGDSSSGFPPIRSIGAGSSSGQSPLVRPATKTFGNDRKRIEKIIFVCFSEKDFHIYQNEIGKIHANARS